MNRANVLGQGKCLVIGYFNGRHTSWCSKNNSRGRILHQWTRDRGWTVSSPNLPTFWNGRSSSPIDLVVHRSVEITKVHVPEGIWTGCTNYSPMVARFTNIVTGKRAGRPTLSKSARINAGVKEKASVRLDEEIPSISACLNMVTTKEDLQRTYTQLVKCLLHP